MLERLLQALEKKGLKKHGRATAVAKATDYSIGAVSAVFLGKEQLSPRFLRAVCRAYGINEDWVKTGQGEVFNPVLGQHPLSVDDVVAKLAELGVPFSSQHTRLGQTVVASARTIPVISCAQAGDNGFWLDSYPVGQGMEQIPCPAQVTDPNAFAFRVEGDSMIPRYYPGETVIVDTTKEVVNNDDVVVRLSDGRVMVKRYRRTNGTVLLESYNPAEDPIVVSPEEIKRCYKVVCRV